MYALILAGGIGEGLLPLTQDRPKPMLLLNGYPVLHYLIRWLVRYEFTNIVICCQYKSDKIVEYFHGGSQFGAQIEYLVEDEPLGWAGALRRGLCYCSDKLPAPNTILAINSNLLTDVNLNELLAYHRRHSEPATLVSVPLISPYGIVDIGENSVITSFREKPELPYWINAGVYVLDPSIKNLLPPISRDHDTTFPDLAKNSRLRVFQTRALWRSVNTIKDWFGLQKEFEEPDFAERFQL